MLLGDVAGNAKEKAGVVGVVANLAVTGNAGDEGVAYM
jgi:hypothetical protein